MTVDCSTRMERKDPGNARLVEREALALYAFSGVQPFTTVHYRKFLEIGESAAGRSLRKLRNMGYVRVHVDAMHKANRYTLAPAVRPVLARLFDRNPTEIRIVRGIGRGGFDHHDGVVDLFVAMNVATARSWRTMMVAFLSERDIRARLGNRKGMQVPDAVAVFENPLGDRMSVAFEVDLGTENPAWFRCHKSIPYTSLREANQPLMGCDHWVVCCTTPSVRRRNRLASVTWEADVPEGLWYFANAEDVNSRSILSDVWLTPRLDEREKRAYLASKSPFQTVRTDCKDSPDRETPVTDCNHGIMGDGESGCLMRGDAS